MLLGGKIGDKKEFIKAQSDEAVLALSIDKPVFFEEIVDRYQEAFIRKARRVLGNVDEVYDVVQETFTKIYLHANSFKKIQGASFKSWGYKILLNTTFTHYQKLKKTRNARADVEPEFLEALPDLSRSVIEERDIRESVTMALSRMPKHLARVLTLQFIEGRSHRDIAALEGISEAATKARVYRAKKEFKRVNLFESI